MKYKTTLLFASLCVAAGAQTNPAETLSQVHIFGASGDVILRMVMQIESNRGTKRRELEVFVRREGGETMISAGIVSPPFLSNIKFLYHRDANGVESKWIRTSLGRRELGGEESTFRLFDSDFTAHDLIDFDPDDYHLRKIPDMQPGNDSIEAIPVAENQGHSRIVFHLSENTSILRAIDYYDEGALTKQFRVLRTESIQGATFVIESIMDDLASDGHTLLEVTSVTLETIPDQTFSPDSL